MTEKLRCERCDRLDSPATPVRFVEAAGMALCQDVPSCNRRQRRQA